MATDEKVNSVLTELSAIAKAPMTPEQREQRSRALVSGEVSVVDIARATERSDLAWTETMANVHGVGVPLWLDAVRAVGLSDSDSLGSLLDRLHAAESAADLLKSGYRPERAAAGDLNWHRA